MICSLFRGRRVHLLGIGGSGVSALVPLLQAVGAVVSGCDVQDSPALSALRGRGVEIHIGHHPSHVHDVDMVVHTAAVAVGHPELAAARERQIPVMSRGQCLIELMRGTRTVAISGSHGKTSTTWMIGHLLTEAGRDPVVMVGGSVASLGGGARTGTGDLFIAETDESDGSFAGVDPEVAILTNLDREHVQYYGDFSHLEERFREWLSRIPASGLIIVPTIGLSPGILSGVKASVLRCGLDEGDCHAEHLELSADGSRMHVILHGQDLGEVQVPLPGAHMALNALMAIAAARHLQPDCPLQSLARCERVRRRFTIHSSLTSPAQGVRVVEDYGHHPTEIRATISAARLGGGRVHVLFQPHRYTRTADLFPEFVSAFDRAGAVVFLPIYAASEPPIPGIDSRLLADSVREHRDAHASTHYTADREEAVDLIVHEAEAGDTILVLGAGDVGELAPVIAHFFPDAGHGQDAAAGPVQREVA
jgi:UDP-N-acetylmuramate--alanine ligase